MKKVEQCSKSLDIMEQKFVLKCKLSVFVGVYLLMIKGGVDIRGCEAFWLVIFFKNAQIF